MPVSARPASSTPSQAASVKAVSLGARKNRLGELLNGTALVKSGTGRSPCSPSRGLNSNAALRKAGFEFKCGVEEGQQEDQGHASLVDEAGEAESLGADPAHRASHDSSAWVLGAS